ncbi:MAG: hypothetical protein CM15mP102_06510 [Flavobacteriales bacterium]|nr:MAG: hypothetical protein CM15mP102_06510 [Flavobacteriales bacterium]
MIIGVTKKIRGKIAICRGIIFLLVSSNVDNILQVQNFFFNAKYY